MKFFLSFFCLFLILENTCANAQDHGIAGIGKADKKSVLLRWGAQTPMSWLQENKYGVIIERYTVVQNGVLHPDVPATRQQLTPASLKPAPLADWEEEAKKNDYAAIAAQAIYGSSFEATTTSGGFVSKLKEASETELRHSFALYAADNSVEAARLSGLLYRDETIEPHTKYLYKVYVPTTELAVDTALVYINTDDIKPVPAPQDIAAKFQEKTVEISWSSRFYTEVFSAYFVERSLNGVDFVRLSPKNTVITQDRNGQIPHRGTYRDSLPETDREYYYRIKAITPFGETSPPSKVIKGKAQFTIEGFNPEIKEVNADIPGTAVIQWDFPEKTPVFT